jgi:carboxymethylenebutenolidase
MTTQAAPFSLDQIGTGTARFPSGMAIPTATDAMVDPYIRTRVSKDVQVECIQFWPQDKTAYPGIVLLHDWWGMNSQITDLGARLACEGYGVIIPKLYGRLGGMVTANAEVAEALMAKCNEKLLLQDINTCCEYLNTTEHTKRNIHGVVGFGMGASLAIRFACQRKRLAGRSRILRKGHRSRPTDEYDEPLALPPSRAGYLGDAAGCRSSPGRREPREAHRDQDLPGGLSRLL